MYIILASFPILFLARDSYDYYFNVQETWVISNDRISGPQDRDEARGHLLQTESLKLATGELQDPSEPI